MCSNLLTNSGHTSKLIYLPHDGGGDEFKSSQLSAKPTITVTASECVYVLDHGYSHFSVNDENKC